MLTLFIVLATTVGNYSTEIGMLPTIIITAAFDFANFTFGYGYAQVFRRRDGK